MPRRSSFLEQSEKVYCLGQETTTFLGESTKHDDRSSNILTIHLDKMFTPATFAYLSNADSMAVVPSEPVTAQQALHRALADNSVTRGWEPQHRIQFFHSRNDMVVPFSNYLILPRRTS